MEINIKIFVELMNDFTDKSVLPDMLALDHYFYWRNSQLKQGNSKIGLIIDSKIVFLGYCWW